MLDVSAKTSCKELFRVSTLNDSQAKNIKTNYLLCFDTLAKFCDVMGSLVTTFWKSGRKELDVICKGLRNATCFEKKISNWEKSVSSRIFKKILLWIDALSKTLFASELWLHYTLVINIMQAQCQFSKVFNLNEMLPYGFWSANFIKVADLKTCSFLICGASP